MLLSLSQLPLALTVAVQSRLLAFRRGDERGQATAEYALVLLGAAAVALLIVAWATKSGAIGELLDKVLDTVVGKVS